MRFDIYHDYQVVVINSYCFYNEYDDLVEECESRKERMCGGKLSDFLSGILKETDFSSVSIDDNRIVIDLFNPMDGTSQHFDISIILEV